MMEGISLAEAVADYEPADDVTDLDTAQRLITALRESIARSTEENARIAGEFTALLSPEHTQKLEELYDSRRLLSCGPDDEYRANPPELDCEAFTDFCEEMIDLAWDMVQEDTADDAADQHIVVITHGVKSS